MKIRGLGIDIDGDGKSDFSISLKTIGMLICSPKPNRYVVYTTIEESRSIELPAPVIERMEFDMKMKLIRKTIMDTQEDVDEIKRSVDKIR